MRVKVPKTIRTKLDGDRTPCEIAEVHLYRRKEINPQRAYRLQKWEWLKDMLASVVVFTDNAFDIQLWTLAESKPLIEKALAGFVRDTGGLYIAKVEKIGKSGNLDQLSVSAIPAQQMDQRKWKRFEHQVKVARERFANRYPELVAMAQQRQKLRKKKLEEL